MTTKTTKVSRPRWTDAENFALEKAYLKSTSTDEFLSIMLKEGGRPLRTIKAYTTQALKVTSLRGRNQSLHDALNAASIIEVGRAAALAITPITPNGTKEASAPDAPNWIDQIDLGLVEPKEKVGFQSNFTATPGRWQAVPMEPPPGQAFVVPSNRPIDPPTAPKWQIHTDGREPTRLEPDGTFTTTLVTSPTNPQSGPSIEDLIALVVDCHSIHRGIKSIPINISATNAGWEIAIQDCPTITAPTLRGALILSALSIRDTARANLSQMVNLANGFLKTLP